jgi:hypothetical protein
VFTPLSPDIIATGTPEGIGAKQNPPMWMKAGDVLEIKISNIGTPQQDRGREVGPHKRRPSSALMLRSARSARLEAWRHALASRQFRLCNRLWCDRKKILASVAQRA